MKPLSTEARGCECGSQTTSKATSLRILTTHVKNFSKRKQRKFVEKTASIFQQGKKTATIQ
jgi:hypothetical protein